MNTNTDSASSEDAVVEIEAVILCDQVRAETTGKLFLIGVFSDVVQVPSLPTPFQLCLAVLARAMSPGRLEFTIEVHDPAGNSALMQSVHGEGTYQGEKGRLTWMPIPLPPFVLMSEGEYMITLDFQGSAKTRQGFLVRRAAPKVQITTGTAPN
jgi:hypothetical protein